MARLFPTRVVPGVIERIISDLPYQDLLACSEVFQECREVLRNPSPSFKKRLDAMRRIYNWSNPEQRLEFVRTLDLKDLYGRSEDVIEAVFSAKDVIYLKVAGRCTFLRVRLPDASVERIDLHEHDEFPHFRRHPNSHIFANEYGLFVACRYYGRVPRHVGAFLPAGSSAEVLVFLPGRAFKIWNRSSEPVVIGGKLRFLVRSPSAVFYELPLEEASLSYPGTTAQMTRVWGRREINFSCCALSEKAVAGVLTDGEDKSARILILDVETGHTVHTIPLEIRRENPKLLLAFKGPDYLVMTSMEGDLFLESDTFIICTSRGKNGKPDYLRAAREDEKLYPPLVRTGLSVFDARTGKNTCNLPIDSNYVLRKEVSGIPPHHLAVTHRSGLHGGSILRIVDPSDGRVLSSFEGNVFVNGIRETRVGCVRNTKVHTTNNDPEIFSHPVEILSDSHYLLWEPVEGEGPVLVDDRVEGQSDDGGIEMKVINKELVLRKIGKGQYQLLTWKTDFE